MTCGEPLTTFVRLLDLYYHILALPSLDPDPIVNKAFTELVSLCLQINIPSKHIFLHLQEVCHDRQSPTFHVRSLIERALEAEGFMERRWAKILAEHEDVHVAMHSFWYFKNYTALTRYELDSLATAGCSAMQRVAFIGSGPLPLTAVLVGRETRGELVLYDRDKEANVLASNWVRRLPVGERGHPAATYSFRDIDVYDESESAFALFDVVWVAASVGIDGKEKRAIVDHIRRGMRPGTFLAVRSVEKGCSLLYPELEHSELQSLNVVCHDVPPQGVVNSVIILRV